MAPTAYKQRYLAAEARAKAAGQELDALRKERDEWRERAQAAEARAARLRMGSRRRWLEGQPGGSADWRAKYEAEAAAHEETTKELREQATMIRADSAGDWQDLAGTKKFFADFERATSPYVMHLAKPRLMELWHAKKDWQERAEAAERERDTLQGKLAAMQAAAEGRGLTANESLAWVDAMRNLEARLKAAEAERDRLAGIAAELKAMQGGRPKAIERNAATLARAFELRQQGMTVKSAAAEMGVSESTFRRLLKSGEAIGNS